MSGKLDKGKPKKELAAIYRLEFYRKQNIWKLCGDGVRRRRDSGEEKPKDPPEAAPILNKTYNVERPLTDHEAECDIGREADQLEDVEPLHLDPDPGQDQSILNEAFLDTPDDNLSPPPNSPCSSTSSTHRLGGLSGGYERRTYDLDPLLAEEDTRLDQYQVHRNILNDFVYDLQYGGGSVQELTQNIGPSDYGIDIGGPQYNTDNYDNTYDNKGIEIDMGSYESRCEIDGPQILRTALNYVDLREMEPRHTLEMERPRYTLEMERPQYTLEMEKPRYTLEMERPQYTLEMERPQYTLEMEKPRYTLEMERPQYTLEMEKPRYTLEMERPQYTLEMERPRFTSEINNNLQCDEVIKHNELQYGASLPSRHEMGPQYATRAPTRASLCEQEGSRSDVIFLGGSNQGQGLVRPHSVLGPCEWSDRNTNLQFGTSLPSRHEIGSKYATRASICEQEGSRSDINFLGVSSQGLIRPHSEIGPQYATSAPAWPSLSEQEGSRSDIKYLGVSSQGLVRPHSVLGPCEWSDIWNTIPDQWSIDSEQCFLRGVRGVPHSTQIDIDLDDSFECYTTAETEWTGAGNGRPHLTWTRDQYNMQPPPNPTYFDRSDIPTRDVLSTNDVIVAGSHLLPTTAAASCDWLASDVVGVGRGRGRLRPQSMVGRARGRTFIV